MKSTIKLIVSGVLILASMYVGSLVVPPVSVFDLPEYLALRIDISSYFFQGLCAAGVSVLIMKGMKLSIHTLFSVNVVVAMLMLSLQSVRVGELNTYFAQYSSLPFLVGVASCLFVAGYLQHLTKVVTGKRKAPATPPL